MIRSGQTIEAPGWLELRQLLWPQDSREAHLAEMARLVAEPGRFAQFLAYGEAGEAVGFAEASLRNDYVNGTSSSPVVFLEGIFVIPPARRRGVARALIEAVEAWGRERGCTEFASDAALENAASHGLHGALGFVETERVVFFRKSIGLSNGRQ